MLVYTSEHLERSVPVPSMHARGCRWCMRCARQTNQCISIVLAPVPPPLNVPLGPGLGSAGAGAARAAAISCLMRLRREASVEGGARGLGCPVRACPHTVEACEASVSSAIKIICNVRACPLRDSAVNGLHCGSCNKCITFNDCPPYTYMLTVQPVAHHMLTVDPVAHHMQRCGAILPCHQFFIMCHNT